jgi:hypothetical protein
VEIAKHTHAAVILSPEWRDVGAVKLLIGTFDNPNLIREDGSSVLEAEILDAIDERGLWIELNSGQKKWPDRPAQKLMVPWKFILAILLQPYLKPHQNKVGYETSEPVPA